MRERLLSLLEGFGVIHVITTSKKLSRSIGDKESGGEGAIVNSGTGEERSIVGTVSPTKTSSARHSFRRHRTVDVFRGRNDREISGNLNTPTSTNLNVVASAGGDVIAPASSSTGGSGGADPPSLSSLSSPHTSSDPKDISSPITGSGFKVLIPCLLPAVHPQMHAFSNSLYDSRGKCVLVPGRVFCVSLCLYICV